MAYWLVKSDPETYSFERMKKEKKTMWDGVRNYAARNNLRAMKKGDLCFFYESMNGEPSVVGIVKVAKEAYQDPTTTEDWSVVDLEYNKALKPVTLKQVKANAKLSQMALVRLSRLSVQPVTDAEWQEVMKMSGS
ncbi:MAG: EVE domain-containing protein [Bacteroidetes bacterium]|nr:EVE domain-containing protein [Bacteroidota bacterium]MBK8657669.1 EVE domain-containing protein [Bacteroidota bacterium]